MTSLRAERLQAFERADVWTSTAQQAKLRTTAGRAAWTGSGGESGKLHVQFRVLAAASIKDEVLHAHQAHYVGAIFLVIRRGLNHCVGLALCCIVEAHYTR
jgi:hypothetical protein